ncbi:NifU family protein [Aeromicrobium sp.]|uniref:NifU family protein n=1 Tax=Aeromicrobium sp. TaxID=1871063 RepID=UPI0030BF96C3
MTQPEVLDHSPDLSLTGERIDALLTASATGGRIAQERAEELVRLVTDLYGSGLEHMMEILFELGHLDDRTLASLAGDELVSGLLLVHGLHPYGIEQRVEDALEGVRPYLGTHGGDVELLEITDEGVVRLRLLGSCDGCPSSSVTLSLAVEGAIEAAAPEVIGIEVEDASPDSKDTGGLISVDSLMSRLQVEPPGGADWHVLAELSALAAGEVTSAEAGGLSLLLCRIGEDLYAFVDRCARCESSLAGSALARRLGGGLGDALLTCPSCQVHYDVRKAGACVDVPELHLNPLPVLADGGTVSVAVPATEVA